MLHLFKTMLTKLSLISLLFLALSVSGMAQNNENRCGEACQEWIKRLEAEIYKLQVENEEMKKTISSNQLAYAVNNDDVETLKEQVALLQTMTNKSIGTAEARKQSSNDLANAYSKDVLEELQGQVALMQNLLNQLVQEHNEPKKD